MANYDRESEDFSASRIVTILRTETVENYTLVVEYNIDRNLLPPKKFIQNRSDAFIKKRQKQLEVYLQTVLRNFVTVPPCLALFLDFHKYEIHGITQDLALQLFHKGDQILEAGEIFYTNPLQLYALCTRLKLAQPTCETGDKTKDIGHILAFITSLKYLHIDGCVEAVGTSNIVPNQLAFLLQNFKGLEKLQIVNCTPAKISGIDSMKKSLRSLHVHHSLKALKDLLLLDISLGHLLGHTQESVPDPICVTKLYWLFFSLIRAAVTKLGDLLLLDMGLGHLLGHTQESVLVPAWRQVHTAIFSKNDITYIDESVKLLPQVKYLDLSHNKLHEIQELQHLSQLTHVDLSHNALRQLQALHTKFGNIKSLNISGNHIQSLQGHIILKTNQIQSLQSRLVVFFLFTL